MRPVSLAIVAFNVALGVPLPPSAEYGDQARNELKMVDLAENSGHAHVDVAQRRSVQDNEIIAKGMNPIIATDSRLHRHR